MRIAAVPGLIGSLLFAFASVASESWLCTEEASQRRGDQILSCGIGKGSDENEARKNAFENSKAEFDRICSRSTDCRGHTVSIEPRRTSCVEKAGSGFICHRLLAFTLGNKYGEIASTKFALPVDQRLVGEWKSKCSTVFGDGKGCGEEGIFEIDLYPDGRLRETYLCPSGSPVSCMSIREGKWSAFDGEVTISLEKDVLFPKKREREVTKLTYRYTDPEKATKEDLYPPHLELKMIERKTYKDSHFAELEKGSQEQQIPLVLVRVVALVP